MYEKKGEENQTIVINRESSYPTEPYQKQYNVLIVDEDSYQLNLCKNAFESKGHKVKTAQNRDDGFKLIQEGSLDAVITEIELPESPTAGLHLLQTTMLECPDIPVIIHTGYNSERILAVLEGLGAYAILKKSADSPTKLMDFVTDALKPKHEKQETQNLYAGSKILYVDGQDLALGIYKTALEEEGYTAKTAFNEKDASAIIAQEELDLVITDVKLKEAFDGLRVLENAKAKDPNMPVIIYTAEKTDMTRVSGAYTIVDKDNQKAFHTLIHTTIREALADREKHLSPLSDGTIERFAKEVDNPDIEEVKKRLIAAEQKNGSNNAVLNEFQRVQREFIVKKFTFD